MNPTTSPENVTPETTVLPCQIEVPPGWDDYFEREGPLPAVFAERRRFPRFFFRRRAVMRYHDALPRRNGIPPCGATVSA